MNLRKLVVGILLLAGWAVAHAVSPTCTSPETKLSWPAVNPVWEMCWVPPNQSVGPDGSGLELRKVYFKGHQVFVRAHAPMLFAEYKNGAGGNCYRDWKDTTEQILSDLAVQGHLGMSTHLATATTSCDRSQNPTASYGKCPYQLPGFPNANTTCYSGVTIEDDGDHVLLTAQYSASWYMYASRWAFYADGHIEPTFGFGNNNGTYNTVTHWHHNYWRFEFSVDGAANTVSTDGVDNTVEFSDLRNATSGPGGGPHTWAVRNPTTGNGYQVVPGSDDYDVPTNQSGRNFHTVDFMATQQHNAEYGDSASNNLSDCTMHQNVLVNGESLVNTNVALYYTVAVRDSTANDWPPGCTPGAGGTCIPQDSMECKKKEGAGLMPFGPWVSAVPAATVTPGDENAFVVQGSQTTRTFGITNSGAVDSLLNYTIDFASVSCATPGAVSWLSATPTSGFLMLGATAPITAHINATSLTPGQYSAFVCVHSDDPANALVSIPVGLTVLDPDFIFVDDFEG
jgi:hypothetical protein